MRALIALSLMTAAVSAQAKEQITYCPKYRCVASASGPSTHGYLSGIGYGDTILEAKREAEQRCVRSNAYGGCHEAKCKPDHGPIYPIFNHCKDGWSKH